MVHPDLSDQSKNAVLWSTARFIENVLTDWNLSGGFWVGNLRFANNDVKNLRDHRKEAFMIFQRTADHLLTAAAPATPTTSSASAASHWDVAFLFVVVEKLGFVKGKDEKPHLLLIGHKQKNDYRHWGVPGGLRDKADPSSLFTAMREFGEEVLGKKHLNRESVDGLIATAMSVGNLVKCMNPARMLLGCCE